MDAGTIIVAVLGSSALTAVVQAIINAITKKQLAKSGVEAHLSEIDRKIDKMAKKQDSQYLSVLRLTIMSEEMPMSERLIAGREYIQHGGNGDVKSFLHKLELQCENHQ